MKKFLIASAVCVLSACGGGGDSSAQIVTPTPVVAHAAVPVAIDAQGDSTMYGSDAEYCATAHWCQTPGNAPAVLQLLLQHEFGPTATVLNFAIPGSYLAVRMQPELQPNQYFTETLANSLSKTTAQIVLINWAINDSVMETPDQYHLLLSNAVANVLQSGKIPVLEEPNPVNDGKHPNLASFVVIMRQVAAETGTQLVTQWDAFNAAPNWQTQLLSSDGVHPSNAGYQFKALREADQLAPLVSKVMYGQ